MTLVHLEELAEWGQRIMHNLGWQEGDSKRVTWTPNSRQIRYYTTLGLLDRPAGFEKRVAMYSGKHLLQLLAIKHLQSGGHKLEDIQRRLLGLSEDSLARLVGIELPLPQPGSGRLPQGSRRREEFWTERPLAYSPRERVVSAPVLRTCQTLEPAPGVQILLDPQRLPAHFNVHKFVTQVYKLLSEGDPDHDG